MKSWSRFWGVDVKSNLDVAPAVSVSELVAVSDALDADARALRPGTSLDRAGRFAAAFRVQATHADEARSVALAAIAAAFAFAGYPELAEPWLDIAVHRDD